MKDELGKKIRNEFVGLKANTYSFLLNDDIDDKTAKSTIKCVKKINLKIIKPVWKHLNLILT